MLHCDISKHADALLSVSREIEHGHQYINRCICPPQRGDKAAVYWKDGTHHGCRLYLCDILEGLLIKKRISIYKNEDRPARFLLHHPR